MRSAEEFSSPRPSPQPQPSSSPSPNPHTKPPPPPWPPLPHNPTPSSSRVRDHEGHEHSSPPVNPATSVIKHNPKIIDLTTNTKYSKQHSRHKIHLNQISRTLTIEAACRRPGRYLPACLHIIGNEPCLTILPTPTSSSTMTESPKYPVVTVTGQQGRYCAYCLACCGYYACGGSEGGVNVCLGD
ncbi:hypothetical protein E4U38_008202 [Claviceps purpurea]|nr:hypothetical protein E4U38_008202 [Claviceps purpurea]